MKKTLPILIVSMVMAVIACSGGTTTSSTAAPSPAGEGGAPEGGSSGEGGSDGGAVCTFPVSPTCSCFTNGESPTAPVSSVDLCKANYDDALAVYWTCEGQRGVACQARCDSALHRCLAGCDLEYDYTCDGSCAQPDGGSCDAEHEGHHGCRPICDAKHALNKCFDDCETAEPACLKACGSFCD
jgi:hypothetical protein